MKSLKKNKKLTGILLLLPLTIWLVAFALYPILYGLRLSLFNARINNIDNPTFIGLQNYVKLFSNSEFGQSLWWSLKFALVATFIQMLLGILIAWLFQREFPGKGLATTLILLPMVVAPFLMGTMFRLLFNESVGPIAYLLSGLTGTTALLGLSWMNQTIIGADTINRMPFVFINMYSAMQGVPQELLEAATMDGPNTFQILTQVLIPVLIPVLLPGIGSTAILGFITNWNEYLFSGILAFKKSVTAMVGTSFFITSYAVEWGNMAAAITLSTIPTALFIFIAQKSLVKGMTAGAVKG